MTRIIAGSAGGRRLAVPPNGTRPTTDRVREALFSSLHSHLDGDWSGVRFLDVYAGSGAVGLEALSRGAASATFIENARGALDVLRKNASIVAGNARIIEASASTFHTRADAPASIAFFDPPYKLTDAELTSVLRGFREAGWMDDDTYVVLERSTRGTTNILDGDAQHKSYGETGLWYGHFTQQSGGM